MLYQFLIEVMIEHSDSLFIGVVLGLFGYIGWMLWKMNEKLKSFIDKWGKYEENLVSLEEKMDKIDDSLYKDLMEKLAMNMREMDKLKVIVNDNNKDLEKMRLQIIAEIKEGNSEVKDIIMFLVNNQTRSINLNPKEKKEINNRCGNEKNKDSLN